MQHEQNRKQSCLFSLENEHFSIWISIYFIFKHWGTVWNHTITSFVPPPVSPRVELLYKDHLKMYMKEVHQSRRFPVKVACNAGTADQRNLCCRPPVSNRYLLFETTFLFLERNLYSKVQLYCYVEYLYSCNAYICSALKHHICIQNLSNDNHERSTIVLFYQLATYHHETDGSTCSTTRVTK